MKAEKKAKEKEEKLAAAAAATNDKVLFAMQIEIMS